MQPKSRFSSGFSAHNGLSARSPVAQFDEFDNSAQAMQPKSMFSSGFSAHNGLSARSPVAQFDEFDYSAQAMQPKSVTPRSQGSVDYLSTRGIQVDVGLPDTTSENRAKSPLYGELYPNTVLAYPVPNSAI